MQLTETQMEILRTLVKLYKEKRRMIKSKEVAEYLNKDEGTVRNMIMWLKGMGLVESRTGPAGGYRPTLKAFRLLNQGMSAEPLGYGEAVIWTEDGKVYRVPVFRLELMNVLTGSSIIAHIKSTGNAVIPVGGNIRIVSKPVERIIIEGTITEATADTGEMIVRVKKLVVIPDALVGEVARKKLITLRPNMSIREAAHVLTSHGIRGAPIFSDDGRVLGFITTTDISRLLAEGVDPDDTIEKYMKHHVFSISETESIIEAIRLMDFHGVGRLLVISSEGRPVGIITRTDILRYIVSVQRFS